MDGFRVSVDVGGTFTDFVVEDEASGSAFTGKVLSTPRDPAGAVLTGTKDLVPNPAVVDILVTTKGLRGTYSIALRDRPARRAGDDRRHHPWRAASWAGRQWP
ncbi:MAG: hydantoinase/oxoprolinase N-terminal domain-containing protein [Bacillota bacterium]